MPKGVKTKSKSKDSAAPSTETLSTQKTSSKNSNKRANDSTKQINATVDTKKKHAQKASKASTKQSVASLFEDAKTNKLVHKYTKYTSTREYKAQLFVKKYLKQAKKNVWIEIISVDAPEYYEFGYLQFKTVVCAIYEQTIQPEYPKKSAYLTAEDYELVCRAIEWDTAKKDIKTQQKKRMPATKFRIEGVVYLNKHNQPPYFIDSAPDTIKVLANNFEENKNSIWSKAFSYINPDFMDYDQFQYKIKKIQQIK
jgi:hypothetical protein